jgi:exopolyphosphatase/pppGpp-phosphohydrolase
MVREEAGVDLEVLSGDDEARLTFLAVRRWFGWSAGEILLIDIGGGSLELAAGGSDGDGSKFPGGGWTAGARAGLGAETPVGPVRLEYGLALRGRDAIFVRLGRWF